MKKTTLMRKAQFGVLAMAMALPVPALAAPLAVPATPTVDSNLVQVQANSRDRFERRRDRFERRRDGAYLNGRRGYRERRPGYRSYNGYWFPPAAFLAGALIGGALSNQRPAGNAHVEWCASQYRSYRASDNTFQPYNGPRRACVSPYR